MTKTPEQMAEEYLEQDKVIVAAINRDAEDLVKDAFLAGYQVGFDAARKQFVNAAKAIKTSDPLSNQQIRQFYVDNFREAIPTDDEESVFWAWTKSSHMQAISWLAFGYKNGKLAAQTNLPTPAKWISVKERLPDHFEDVITFEDGECYRVNSISQLTNYWWDSDEGFERHPSHWMPLPEAPKEEK